MKRLPCGCLTGCLWAQKVACFPCAGSHRNFRQLSTKVLVYIGSAWLPTLATVSTLGNVMLPVGSLEGCQWVPQP